MRTRIKLTASIGVVLSAALVAADIARAQRFGGGNQGAADALVTRMMVFDVNKDGTLTKAEISDDRLLRLFERADTNHDGLVTKTELTTLAVKEVSNVRSFGPRGRGGTGGPGGPMMGFRPGQVLPPMFQQILNLSAEQKAQLAILQKEVDAKLAKVLTTDQQQQLKNMQSRGPGGPG